MPTVELSLSEPTYIALKQKAQQYDQSIEEVAQAALTTFLATSEQKPALESNLSTSDGAARRAKIHAEAEAWRTMPESERNLYRGQFVAVHKGQIIDHAVDRLLLYRRVREKLGNVPVLITPAGEPHPREFQLLSPRMDKRVR